MPRYKITIEYVGTNTVGWQAQQEGVSIQGSLVAAIKSMTGDTSEVIGAGRTDAGVHATGQVAHFDLSKEWDLYSLLQGLNYHLRENMLAEPCPISVIDVEQVADDFSARFDATKRYYQYLIINRPARLALMAGRAWFVPEQLNVEAMQEGAKHLVGTHDFSSFRDAQCQAKSPVKTLEYIDIVQAGQTVITNLYALSFLHHQVRIIMGTLWAVGTGRMEPDDVKIILEAKDRKKAGITAPSGGLYLTGVDYPLK